MNYTNTLFFINLPRIRVTNKVSVENKKGEIKMKTKIILTLATLMALNAKAVDNVVSPVDNLKITYSCYAKDSSFVLVEENNQAVVTEFQGADLYEGGVLQVVSKKTGFKSSQTTYQLAQGAELIISTKQNLGRGGGRGGRGGFDDFFLQITSAKLTQNENVFYFSCN
jgi:hypothetical protein